MVIKETSNRGTFYSRIQIYFCNARRQTSTLAPITIYRIKNKMYHFLHDLVKSNILNLVYINTHENLANLFTKGLPKAVHQDLTYEIGVLFDQGGVLET